MHQGRNRLLGTAIGIGLAAAFTTAPGQAANGGPGGPGGILFVNQAANGAHTGATWADAYPCLQDALEHARLANADGDEATDIAQIWIAAGTYTPDQGTGDRQATFALIDGVGLYGGFSGGESSIEDSARQWQQHPTILSGDLSGDDGPDFTNRQDNAYHVVTAGNPHVTPAIEPVGVTTVLDGLIISGGHAAGGAVAEHFNHGGGLYSVAGSPLLRNVLLHDNAAESLGGAMYLSGASPVMENVQFIGNQAGVRGGAVAAFLGSQPLFTDCHLIENHSTYFGGAVYLADHGTHATVQACQFKANTAASGGGLMATGSGAFTVALSVFEGNSVSGVAGAIRTNVHLDSTITDCLFVGNHAGGGGGAIRTSTQFTFPNQMHVRGSTFIGNSAGGAWPGGAIYAVNWKGDFINNLVIGNEGTNGSALSIINSAFGGPESSVRILNTTIADNAGSPPIAIQKAQPLIENSIIWHDGLPPITTIENALPSIHYSNFAPGGFAFIGAGNINSEPHFAAPERGDYRLLAGCESIDAGSNNLLPEDLTTDINGDPRVQDGTGDGMAIVNMGATETVVAGPSGPKDCPADLTGDGAVGVGDLLVLLAAWGPAPTDREHPADLDGNGAVDTDDLLLLLSAWGDCG